MRQLRWLAVFQLLAGSADPVDAAAAGEAPATKQRVQFIGNSFSFVSGGIWDQYKAIAEACIPGLQVTTHFEGQGAATLRMLGESQKVQDVVNTGDYDILVLQDQSELAERGTDAVATVFAPAAAKSGALLAFYETWATPEADGDNMTAGTVLRKEYYEMLQRAAEKAGAKRTVIARAGEAFLEILKEHGFDYTFPAYRHLLSGDWDHPSEKGLNLAAWTMVHAFNADSLPRHTGCDAGRAALVEGQSERERADFARVGCELAGVCPRSAPADFPKQCQLAVRFQGDWMRRRRHTDNHDVREERWSVSGTAVTRTTTRGDESGSGETHTSDQHMLRVSSYGEGPSALCFVKLMPEFVYLKRVVGDKAVFNDCSVWTRAPGGDGGSDSGDGKPLFDECWCVNDGKWRDVDGDPCSAYGHGKAKHNADDCETGGNQPISMFKNLRARQVCQECGSCTPPPEHLHVV